MKLFLHHQLALLALNDSKGTFGGTFYQYAFAGGVLSELLLQKRISVDPEKQLVSVLLNEPVGDPIVDEVLGLIAGSEKARNMQHWVSKAANLKNLKHRIADALCELGILEKDEKKVLWLFTQQIYPEIDGTVEDELRAMMAETMFGKGDVKDIQMAVLIALAKHSDLLKDNFPKVELQQHAKRIEEISKGENLAATAAKEAIEAIQAAILVAVILPSIMASTTATVAR